MRTISGFRAACLALGLAVLGAACSTPQRDSSANGVPGGILRVLTTEADISLDTAGFPYPAIARAYARALYGHNLAGSPERATVPVPDIAAGPPSSRPTGAATPGDPRRARVSCVRRTGDTSGAV
jgi:hypothetical protein